MEGRESPLFLLYKGHKYMKTIRPIVFQQSHLTSTTAVNVDANWSSGTTYSAGQIVSNSGKRWESLQGSNLNKPPTTEPLWWLDLGADNKNAMFDNVVATSTNATTSLTVVITPGQTFDSVALININASVVSISITDGPGGPVVYENTIGLSSETIIDWYGYFFYDPLLKRTQAIFYNIPPYPNAVMTITLSNSVGEQVSVSTLTYGTLFSIGETQYGLSSGIVDYSVKTTDEFGNTTFVKRAYSKRLSGQVAVRNSDLNRVQSLMYGLRATPAVWIASDIPTLEEVAIVFGWYRDFTTEISYPTYSLMSIELESLT